MVQRRDSGYTGQRKVNMKLSARRKRGRPQRRFMDVAKEDMQRAGVTEVDPRDRVRQSQISNQTMDM